MYATCSNRGAAPGSSLEFNGIGLPVVGDRGVWGQPAWEPPRGALVSGLDCSRLFDCHYSCYTAQCTAVQ